MTIHRAKYWICWQVAKIELSEVDSGDILPQTTLNRTWRDIPVQLSDHMQLSQTDQSFTHKFSQLFNTHQAIVQQDVHHTVS
jgi:hypothetical protein